MFATRGRRSHALRAVESLALALGLASHFLAASAAAEEGRAPAPRDTALSSAGVTSTGTSSSAAPEPQPPSSPSPSMEGANAAPTNPETIPAAPAATEAVSPPVVAPKPVAHTDLPPERSDDAPHGRLAGIYVRFGLGFSSFHDTMITDRRIDDKAVDESFVGGFSTVTELAIGGSLSRRFVLGAGFYGASIADPSFTYVRGQQPPESFKRPEDFGLFALMGDFYLYPSHGFHIQAGLGLATLSGFSADSQLFRARELALGGGAMLGVGYEWPAGDRWGIGILGRAVGGVTSETSDGQRWYHLIGVSPALLLSVTYH